MPTKPFCLKIETRKRARSPKAKPKSAPPFSCSSFCDRSGAMLFIRATVSSGSRTLVSSRFMWPSSRSTGGCPTAMCRSLALRLTTVCNSLSMRIVPIAKYLPIAANEAPVMNRLRASLASTFRRRIRNRIEKLVVLGVPLPLALSVTIIRNFAEKDQTDANDSNAMIDRHDLVLQPIMLASRSFVNRSRPAWQRGRPRPGWSVPSGPFRCRPNTRSAFLRIGRHGEPARSAPP